MRGLRLSTMLVGLPLATACGRGETVTAEAVVRVDSAGVEIVRSSGVDRPLPWTLAEVWRLGGAAEGPESFTRVGSHNLGADIAGNLYLMDGDASRIVVFDPGGEHLRSMGRKGEGPGELQFPIGLSVTPGGAATVFDVGKGGLVPFGPEGSALPQVPFPHYTDPGVRHFQKTDDGVTVARSVQIEGRRGVELVAWRDDADGQDTVRFVYSEFEAPEMVDFGCIGLALRPLFAPTVRWAMAGGRIATATTGEYRVDVYQSDGRLSRSVRRSVSPGRATLADAIAEAEPGIRMVGAARCEITAAEVAEGRGYLETTPAIRDIRLAEDGTLWVERFEPGTPAAGRSGTIDVFDASGAYLGSLPGGTRFPILLLPDDRVALAEKDALDVERLVVMQVSRLSSR
jgi:hypothetical protein